jgi:hypothetical protein
MLGIIPFELANSNEVNRADLLSIDAAHMPGDCSLA